MNKKNLKKNNGISMMDVILAIIILCIFVGVIGNLYYQIILNNNLIRLNAIAVYYAVKIAEDTDKMTYDEVNNDLNQNLKTKYDIPNLLNITVDVQNYNKNDSTKQDIIKILTINVEYKCFEESRFYELKKLKIKEM